MISIRTSNIAVFLTIFISASNLQATEDLKNYLRDLEFNPRELLAIQGDGATIEVVKPGVPGSPQTSKNAEGKIIRCTPHPVSLSRNLDEVIIFTPTAGVVYPGALVHIDRNLVNGQPTNITGLKRAPIKLFVDLPGMKDTFTVLNPAEAGSTQIALNAALNEWNNENPNNEGYVNASRSNFTAKEMFSKDQLAIELGASGSWMNTTSVSAQMAMASSDEKKVIIALYKQIFYTVSVDTPFSPAAVFDESVTANEARHEFNAEHPPGYVQSVSYGRLILLRMETSKKFDSVNAAAALQYSSGNISAEAEAKVNYEKILNESSITVITLGGNASVSSFANGAASAKDLQKIISGKNALYSKSNPGSPIAYTVKFLAGHEGPQRLANTIAKMGVTTDYVENRCEELKDIFAIVSMDGAYDTTTAFFWDLPGRPFATGNWTIPNGIYNIQCALDRINNPSLWPHCFPGIQVVNPYQWSHYYHVWSAGAVQFRQPFPADATNIRMYIGARSGDGTRVLFNKVLGPKDLNKCYQACGTAGLECFNVFDKEPPGAGGEKPTEAPNMRPIPGWCQNL